MRLAASLMMTGSNVLPQSAASTLKGGRGLPSIASMLAANSSFGERNGDTPMMLGIRDPDGRMSFVIFPTILFSFREVNKYTLVWYYIAARINVIFAATSEPFDRNHRKQRGECNHH